MKPGARITRVSQTKRWPHRKTERRYGVIICRIRALARRGRPFHRAQIPWSSRSMLSQMVRTGELVRLRAATYIGSHVRLSAAPHRKSNP